MNKVMEKVETLAVFKWEVNDNPLNGNYVKRGIDAYLNGERLDMVYDEETLDSALYMLSCEGIHPVINIINQNR